MLPLASHGGIEFCTADEIKILEWYKFIQEESYFLSAETKCKHMGAELFHSLNGTKAQLDFFYDKLEPLRQCFWTGIWADSNGTWRTPDDEKDISLDLFTWGEHPQQPNAFFENEDKILGYKFYETRDYLHNTIATADTCKAVCEF